MRPEPGSRPPRKRKRWPNESRPLSIRVGAIRDELDARSDGTESGYRAVITRDLRRFYELLPTLTRHDYPLDVARGYYDSWQFGNLELIGEYAPLSVVVAITDALERAHILVTHAGLTVDTALVAVGLVKEEKK
jgi:hypothetical protein